MRNKLTTLSGTFRILAPHEKLHSPTLMGIHRQGCRTYWLWEDNGEQVATYGDWTV